MFLQVSMSHDPQSCQDAEVELVWCSGCSLQLSWAAQDTHTHTHVCGHLPDTELSGIDLSQQHAVDRRNQRKTLFEDSRNAHCSRQATQHLLHLPLADLCFLNDTFQTSGVTSPLRGSRCLIGRRSHPASHSTLLTPGGSGVRTSLALQLPLSQGLGGRETPVL